MPAHGPPSPPFGDVVALAWGEGPGFAGSFALTAELGIGDPRWGAGAWVWWVVVSARVFPFFRTLRTGCRFGRRGGGRRVGGVRRQFAPVGDGSCGIGDLRDFAPELFTGAPVRGPLAAGTVELVKNLNPMAETIGHAFSAQCFRQRYPRASLRFTLGWYRFGRWPTLHDAR